MGTSRMESFSDGVMAVAITLLVLGITVPTPDAHHSLISELGRRWPAYAAYVTSFLTIGIIWINHHAMISRLEDSDHQIKILNLLLLMTIGVLPFATNLMATYLRQSSGQAVAAAIYSGSLLVMSLAFSALNRLILLHRAHMITGALSLEQRRRILASSLIGLVPYAVATALAFVSPYVTLGICAAVALYYAQPTASGAERGRAS
ncbi:MAG: TMEM175 family protein [Actinomycetota bacterium]|nr:TMEM175 family protein [Actinomycetota bacterium]